MYSNRKVYVEQQKILAQESHTFVVHNKTKWVTCVHYENGERDFGIDDTKKGSEMVLTRSYAELGVPDFITDMGSVNKELKEFVVLSGATTYLKKNVPLELFACYLPIVSVNPTNKTHVALICEDMLTKEIFYIHSNKETFKDSLDGCINQLYIEFLTKREINEQYPKINNWVLTYLKRQKLSAFDDYIHLTKEQ